MTEQFTQYSRTGYGGRIGNAFGTALFGLLLFAASFFLLFWNEGRAVKTSQMLKEGAASVVSVDSASIVPANDGKLVYFNGQTIGKALADPLFQVNIDPAIHLRRVVKMYQWKEKRETNAHTDAVGGGQTSKTTFTYSKVWSDALIDSSSFQYADSHHNPSAKRIDTTKWTAEPVIVGAFTLPGQLVDRIDNYQPVVTSEDNRQKLPDELKSDSVLTDGFYYISGQNGRMVDPQQPQIGDLQVAIESVAPGPVSVIAKQTGNTVAPYPTRSGKDLQLLYTGVHPAAEMFATEQQHNKNLSWILRGVGFACMWFGLMALARPLSVVASVVGLVGDVVGAGVAFFSFLLAVMLSSVVIAVAWVFYRPVLGISLFALAGVAGVLLIVHLRRRKSRSIGVPALAR